MLTYSIVKSCSLFSFVGLPVDAVTACKAALHRLHLLIHLFYVAHTRTIFRAGPILRLRSYNMGCEIDCFPQNQ